MKLKKEYGRGIYGYSMESITFDRGREFTKGLLWFVFAANTAIWLIQCSLPTLFVHILASNRGSGS